MKFYLPLILPEEHMNFKISNIPGNSVYIDRQCLCKVHVEVVRVDYTKRSTVALKLKIFKVRKIRKEKIIFENFYRFFKKRCIIKKLLANSTIQVVQNRQKPTVNPSLSRAYHSQYDRACF